MKFVCHSKSHHSQGAASQAGAFQVVSFVSTSTPSRGNVSLIMSEAEAEAYRIGQVYSLAIEKE